MNDRGSCPFCGLPVDEIGHGYSFYLVRCPNCGDYEISHDDQDDFASEFRRNPILKNTSHLLSGYLRTLNDRGEDKFQISIQKAVEIIESGQLPITIREKLDSLLEWFYRQSDRFAKDISFNVDMPSIAYAHDRTELQKMVFELVREGYLYPPNQSESRHGYQLSIKGIDYIETRKKEVKEKQCFIAMWFSHDMMDIFKTTISKAIQDSNYDPLIISMKEHNDNINDHIISEIRKSRFIVADFTGNRGGVYFEAGFAMGLGKPVIWTCRKDHFDQTYAVQFIGTRETDDKLSSFNRRFESKIHFDVNHYNFIVWETAADLYQKLKDRICATIV